MEEETDIILKLNPFNKEIKFKKYEYNNWEFVYNNGILIPSKDVNELIKNNILFVNRLPELIFGYNRMYLINKSKNFIYSFNPIDMINLIKYDIRKTKFDNKEIYYNPPEIDAKRDIDPTHLQKIEIQKKESVSDWTYSSPYMGTVTNIPNSEIFNQIDFNINNNIDNNKLFKGKIDPEIKIPYENLGPNNPIINNFEIHLYEDDLNDNGLTDCKLRFRIMKDCFFGLLRCYLRIDNFLIKNIDTRIYHDFNTDYIVRHFVVKEMTYTELKNKGFEFKYDFNISPNQSDLFDNFVKEEKFSVSDKIML